MTDRTAEHADFAPSSIARRIQCPGSWKMERLHPQDSNATEAAEGTAAHWVCAQFAKLTEAQRANYPGIGTLTPNGIPITMEMLEGADLWCDNVKPGPTTMVEQQLPPSELLDPDNWGTPDAVNIPHANPNVPGFTIEISDYKFGHRYVDVYKNWQLMNYAFLVLDMLKIDGLQEQNTRLVFKIVQPRNYDSQGPVRTWSCLASDLRAERNALKSAILLAKSEQAQCWVGPECQDCSARAFCPTLQRASLAAVDMAGKPIPVELPPEALGLEIRIFSRAEDLIHARRTGLEEVALAKFKGGVNIPGFIMEQGKGREKWNIPMAQIEAIEGAMKVKLTEKKAITPKQAIKAGLSAEVVGALTETPPGTIKLKEDDGSLLRRTFGYK